MSAPESWTDTEKHLAKPDRLDTAITVASDAFRNEVYSCLKNPIAREILPSPQTIDFTLRLGATLVKEALHMLPAWAKFEVQTKLPALLDSLKHVLLPEGNGKVPCYPSPIPPCFGGADQQPKKAPNYYERRLPVLKPADDHKKDCPQDSKLKVPAPAQPQKDAPSDNKPKAPVPGQPQKDSDETKYKHSKDAEGNDVLEDPTTGIRITTKKNGDEITEYKNGDVITEFHNGDKIFTHAADGSVTRTDKNGRYFTTDKNGKVIDRGQEAPDSPPKQEAPVAPKAQDKPQDKPQEVPKPAAGPTEWKGEKGQVIKSDAQGHPVEIRYPNGLNVKMSQLGPDGKPNLVEISGPENQILKRRGQSEEYDVVDKSGKPTGDVVHKVELHKDGSAVIHGEKDLGFMKQKGYMVVDADGQTHQHLA